MAKVRPCKKGCGYPALKARQFCEWHHLMRQSSDVQADAAVARLATFHASWEYHVAGANIDRKPKRDWPEGERWCAGCQSFVPLFYCSGSRCKACNSAANHARRLEDNYGIDAAEYKRILALQGGKCAVCQNTPRTIRFAVDHDHKTGEVRGILCKRCNHDLLGGGHDDVLILWRAVKYLLSPPASCGPVFTDKVAMAVLEDRLSLRDRLAVPRPQVVEPAPF